MKQHLSESLVKVRQTLASKISQDSDGGLPELQAMLVMPTIEKIKGVLQDLLVSKISNKVLLNLLNLKYY